MLKVKSGDASVVSLSKENDNLRAKYEKIELGHLTVHNIKQLRLINQAVFPVTYTEKFYTDVLKNSKMCRLAYFNDIVVGAVSYRLENVPVRQADHVGGEEAAPSQFVKKCYIMTLGCLAPYRGHGIGSLMLKHVMKFCQKHGSIRSIYLHVHVENDGAVAFYKKFGFEITGEVEGYYRRIHPQTAYVLEKACPFPETYDYASDSD